VGRGRGAQHGLRPPPLETSSGSAPESVAFGISAESKTVETSNLARIFLPCGLTDNPQFVAKSPEFEYFFSKIRISVKMVMYQTLDLKQKYCRVFGRTEECSRPLPANRLSDVI